MRRLDMLKVLGEVDGEQLEAEYAEHLDRALRYAAFLGEVLKGAPGRWADRAACKGLTPRFFPERGESAAIAHDLCATCTVRPQCAAWADEVGTGQGGILAGQSERARQRRRVERRRAA